MSGDARHCTDVLAEHAAGLTSGPRRAEVEVHLRECRSCRAALADWTAVAAAMGASASAPPPAAQMGLDGRPPRTAGQAGGVLGELVSAVARVSAHRRSSIST